MLTKASITYSLTALNGFFSVATSSAIPQALLTRQSGANSNIPPPPSQDPFYAAPLGFEDASPGDILRVRENPSLVPIMGNSSAAYNILYRTTDSNFEPAWAVTTLWIPVTGHSSAIDNNGNSSANILSYQYPYDSANIDESPSWTPFTNPERIEPALPVVLGRGWYVNVPDYEGPLASFGAGVQSGHATLDSVRAVLKFAPEIGLSSTSAPRYALWGYSGGSLASEWAAELQVQYAPELDFAGVAVGGMPANITSVLRDINVIPGGNFTGLIPNLLVGITSQDEAARQALREGLRQEGEFNATAFFAVANQTLDESNTAFAGQDIWQYFVKGEDVLREEALLALINRDAIMGYHGVPAMPVFAYHAIADQFTPVADVDVLVERFCGVGANIAYQRNTVGEHVSEFVVGTPRVLDFLSSVFDGSYAHTGCSIEDVTIE